MADQLPTQPQTKPHFIQPVVSDLGSNFLIPADICKHLEEGICSNLIQLRSRCRKKPWVVKIEGRRMVNGWEQFVRENDLHVGEYLLFSYEGDMLFDVTVLGHTACKRKYPLADDVGDPVEDGGIGTPELEGNADIRKRGKYISSRVGADSFVGRMKPSYMNNLYFPITFVLEHELLRTNSGILIEDENGKTWPMKLCIRRDSNVVYTYKQEWVNFVEENGIMEGDEFEIRIVSKGIKPLLAFRRISATQKRQISDHGNIQNVEKVGVPKAEVVPQQLKRQKVEEVYEQATKRASIAADKPMVKEVPELKTALEEMPNIPAAGLNISNNTRHCKQKPNSSSAGSSTHFYQTSTWASIHQSRININIEFARANDLPNKCGNIILKNEKGESWPAKLRYKRCRSQDCYYIGGGWKEFALNNGLGVGCRFKMEIEKSEQEVLTMKLCECTHEGLTTENSNAQ